MVNKGEFIRVQTTTKDDVFGVCYYEIVETGIKPPEKGREKEMDGVKAVMIGGSGPAARKGMTIIDSQMRIATEIARGITEVISREQAKTLMKASGMPGEGARPGTGVVEMN